ncbi:MAG TPA: hotdog fold thioesterase [Anaeromyxobacter sp.]|nr:hotdog fold thioesterase [Anaeromyxobacter sp.]
MPPHDPTVLVRRLMQGDRWAALAGAKLVEAREGYALVRMRLRRDHLNGVGVAQGGAVFTLADFAFAVASNSHGTVAVALDVSITFTRAAREGVLTAEAREESVSRRVSVCNVRVTDGRGEVVALFRGTAFRKEEPIAALLAAAGRERAPRRSARGPVSASERR